jgi:hypothetical protein
MAKVLIFAVPSVPAELFGGRPKEREKKRRKEKKDYTYTLTSLRNKVME